MERTMVEMLRVYVNQLNDEEIEYACTKSEYSHGKMMALEDIVTKFCMVLNVTWYCQMKTAYTGDKYTEWSLEEEDLEFDY